MSIVIASSLLHFLWQGALIGVVAMAVMHASRSPRVRCVCGFAALLIMAAAPLATGARLSNIAAPRAMSAVADDVSARPSSLPRNVAPANSAVGSLSLPSLSSLQARTLTVLWIVGVAFLSLRLAFSWMSMKRLARSSFVAPSPELAARARQMAAAVGVERTVRVIESSLATVPMTMGWLKPVILLPAAMLTGLTMAHVDALLAHELAHVKRRDYLMNLIQMTIETLLFYHPAVWIVSNRVRQERELCCDDIAIEACGHDRLSYASALAELEGLRQALPPALAANDGSLLARVRRILAPPDSPLSQSRSHWFAAIAALLIVSISIIPQRVQGRQQLPSAVGTRDGVSGGTASGLAGGNRSGAPAGELAGVRGGISAPSSAVVAPPSGSLGGIIGGTRVADVSKPVSDPQIVDYASIDRQRPSSVITFSDPVIGPFRIGDHIRIEIGMRDDPNWSATYTTVLNDGSVGMFEQPNLRVDGLTSHQVMDRLAERYAEQHRPVPPLRVTFDDRSDSNVSLYARKPDAPVAPATQSTQGPQRIFVRGFVDAPGEIPWVEGMTLERALALAVVNSDGARNRVSVRRQNAEKNGYEEVSLPANKDTFSLQPNDIVMVPRRRGPEQQVPAAALLKFSVEGSVAHPGEFVWKAGMFVGEGIANAGGATKEGAVNRVSIRRLDLATKTYKEIRGRADMRLEAGDVIVVPQKYF